MFDIQPVDGEGAIQVLENIRRALHAVLVHELSPVVKQEDGTYGVACGSDDCPIRLELVTDQHPGFEPSAFELFVMFCEHLFSPDSIVQVAANGLRMKQLDSQIQVLVDKEP